MLNVQVQYLNYLETKRHDLATEDIGYRTIAETNRHNLVTESQEATKIEQNQQQINELIRHNKASEAIGYMQANAALRQAETSRMLADAQIPLITAQAYSAKEEAKQAHIKTYYTKQNAESSAAKLYYEAQEQQLKAENYTSLSYLKAIGSIIPF